MRSRRGFIHIVGTEVEYDVYDPTAGVQKPAVMKAMQQHAQPFGIVGPGFIRGLNGCRAYGEVAEKIEYAGPECTNGSDGAVHEIAGSVFWAVQTLFADYALARDARAWVLKTNTSRGAASSGGNHINISMPLRGQSFPAVLEETVEYLKAFVATLQLITGSGVVVPQGLVSTRLHQGSYGYAISPRAIHVVKNQGVAHTSSAAGNKPIFMDRNEPLGDPNAIWRLQISGLDSNILPSVIQLKLDLLLLFAEMTARKALEPVRIIEEDSEVCRVMRRISCDWRTVLETNKGPMTPLQVQWHYFHQAELYVNGPRHGRGLALLNQWAGLLREFDTPDDLPLGLYGKVDWVTKAVLLRKEAAKINRRLKYGEAEDRHFMYHAYRLNLKEAELTHFLSHGTLPDGNRFCTPFSLIRAFGPPGLMRKIWQGLKKPPSDTRASARGRFVAARPKDPSIDWHYVGTTGFKTVKLLNPAVPTTHAFEALLRQLGGAS